MQYSTSFSLPQRFDMKVTINFAPIVSIRDFYKQFRNRLNLPGHFGENLDAVHDVISGDLEMPLEIEFVNVNEEKRITFGPLFETMKSLSKEVEGFTFNLHISHSVFG